MINFDAIQSYFFKVLLSSLSPCRVAFCLIILRPRAPHFFVSVSFISFSEATEKQTIHSGFVFEPPGPAIPVIEIAKFAFELLIAPIAISPATSSETAP